MICPNCQAPVQDGSPFCPRCGTPFSYHQPQQSYPPQQPYPPQGYPQQQPPAGPPPRQGWG